MRHRSLPWLVLSIILHGAAGLALFRVSPPVQPDAAFAPLTFELVVAAPARVDLREDAAPSSIDPAPALTSVPDDRRRASPPRSLAPKRVAISTRPARSSLRPAPESASIAAASDEQERASDTRQPLSTGAALDLSPRAAARTLIEQGEQPMPSAEERLNRVIAEGAMRRQPPLSEPELRPRPEGGYVYAGRGFYAVIESNGDVKMVDSFGTFTIPLVPFRTPDGEWHFALFGGSFSLFEWLDKKLGKNDPYRSERRWFLDRTRALRERLAREHAPRPGRR